MKIISVTPAKQHLNIIALDNGEKIYLDKDFPLTAGEDIETEKLKKLIEESDYARAKSRALWYLDRMDYSEKKLYDKLVEKGFDKRACSRVLAKLCELGLVDDRRYAERIAERLMESNISKRAALQKMLQKGLPYDLCRQLLTDYEVDEQSQIIEIIEKKYSSKLEEQNGYQKVYAALVRKGFSYGDVSTALKKYVSEDYDV